MKNVACTLTICFLIVCGVKAQNISDLEAVDAAIKPGAVLTYDVTDGGKKYQLVVTLKKVGDEITFDWATTAPANKTGAIAMNTNAVAKADALFSAFTGGNTQLDKETALFISHKIFNDVSTTSVAGIKIAGAGDTATAMSNTISEFNFNVNGNLVAVPGWELEGGGDIKYTLDVIESYKFPLIFKLEAGYTLQLVEIKNM